MPKHVEIRIAPRQIDNEVLLKKLAVKASRYKLEQVQKVQLIRKSIDSRRNSPKYVLRYKVYTHDDKIEDDTSNQLTLNSPLQLKPNQKVLVIGAGPAGYFAALQLLSLGLQPIVLDRGKDVRARRRDLRQIQQFGTVNPNSNYCFGEGGAGTYSDGKLYTRATKRGDVMKVLQTLVAHGAKSDILWDAHPHIGSNKLPKIIAAMRETIISGGGEIHFDTQVVDFIIVDNEVKGVTTAAGAEWYADAVILATGHSARDIYALCDDKDIAMEFKPFAMGVRVEHPQPLIDSIQYHIPERGKNLPAASYNLACQVGTHGVYSFCMCPGGLIVPAATAPGELVVNGMSLSRRDSPFANAGTVVSLDHNPDPGNVFGGLAYQKQVEQSIFSFGDGSQKAPAQRLTDFVAGKVSSTVGDSSYIPGIYSAPMHEILPTWIAEALRKGIRSFDNTMKGYFTSEAHVIGLESRTSAPVRIMRDDNSLMSISHKALFPCGEGAGFAGGILSAALDGIKVASYVAKFVNK